MSTHYVIGSVDGQAVALIATAVESVVDIDAITIVPLAPLGVVGLCAVRSQVLTVIDVAMAIGLPTDSKSIRVAIVAVEGHAYALRMTSVDDAIAVRDAPMPIDASVGAGWHAIATGRIETAAGFALVIDPARIVAVAAQAKAWPD